MLRGRRTRLAGGALATIGAGVGLALLVSGAGAVQPSNEVTIFGDRQEVITIYGSLADDSITLRGSPAGSITILGDNISEGREDCGSVGTQTAYCDHSAGVQTITAALRDGDDKLSVENQIGVKVVASGASGADKLFGFDDPDTLSGGADDDKLKGGGGKDKLDGGKGKDNCDGEQGKDDVTDCEAGEDGT